ncbi:organic cation transporter protein-like [Cydia strobilella]|uniref:organic cation transporter protein-like n=1 Tax=Cydia strobilella TaxID=1100964 RepID=UPI003005C437
MVLVNDIIGTFRKYQWWICFIIYVNKFGIAWHQMAIIFLAPPVAYRCPENTTCCKDPIYDTSTFKNTIVMEWNLICENSWLKDFTQTLFQFGVLVGSLLFGMASDRYGRKKAMISSVVLEVFMGVIASFVPDYWSFTIIRMILGFSIGGVMVVGFVIIMEFVGNEKRAVVSALYQVPFTLGHILLAAFGYYLRDYTHFQLAISIANVYLLLYICLLPETPRWLMAKNKTDEAVILLTCVAKINNMPTEDIKDKVEMYELEHRTNLPRRGSTIDLFRTPNLRKNILVMSFAWFTCSYCFYGIAQYISQLTEDIFVNVALSGFFCLISCFIAIPMMRYMKRRTIVVISNAISGISLLLLAGIPQGIISVVLACIGVLFSFVVFIVVYLYCTEMFPTVVRNAALGISSMMARLGAMIAPFVCNLRMFDKWAAPVAFGVLPLIAAVLCLLLPETKNCELLTTIEEGEALGTSQPPRPADAADGI